MKIRQAADIAVVRNSESGITLIETLMAGTVLLLGSLSMIVLIIGSIATNNRNKMDSTQTMLATSVLEQINSTFIGAGTSTLVDCSGASWTIQTGIPAAGTAGATLTSGGAIDFSQTTPPTGYRMDYIVRTP